MRLLVLGGTVFCSHAVAAEAVARGHDVTCACRGISGEVPEGARLLAWDREADAPDELTRESFDAVVDVARHPSRVRAAVELLPQAHWVFVSSISVYADHTTPGGTPETLPLHEPIHTDEDPYSAPEIYGAMKVGCEQIVQQGAASSTVVRPGLIVGPGDPSGRFSYWPHRLGAAADGDEVLAPGDPDDRTQVIDVRDLASWLVDAAEQRLTGVYDATGPAMQMADLLAELSDGVGVAPELVWAGHAFLTGHEVEPWMGDHSLPLWLPRPEYDGMCDHDVSAAFEAGLSTRPLADTARDTLAWLRDTPDPPLTGLTIEEERKLLDTWRVHE